MVGIGYEAGVVLCRQYTGRLNGLKFADMIRAHFPSALNLCFTDSKCILQDGCPVQNSAAAKHAFKDIGAEIYSIPPRSPDINVIENFFKTVESNLREEALQKSITKETYEQFCVRIERTIKSIPLEYINKTIESLNKRMDDILKRNGQHIKY